MAEVSSQERQLRVQRLGFSSSPYPRSRTIGLTDKAYWLLGWVWDSDLEIFAYVESLVISIGGLKNTSNKLIVEWRMGVFKLMSAFEEGEKKSRLVVSNDKDSI